MGRATALHLSQHGFRVYAGSRTPESLDAAASDRLHPVQLDITDVQSIAHLMERIGSVDILVNNAGYGLVSTVEEVTEAQMQAQFDVNVFGLLRMCKAVIPGMRERRQGIIVNISSFLGRIGLPLLTFYNASKYAVEGITDSLRYELGDFDIRVHSILPGFFDTDFARGNLVTNEATFDPASPYAAIVSTLAPQIVAQINHGNPASEIAEQILGIITDGNAPAHQTAGEKAQKFIPMKKELSDEDFERRVRAYYDL